MSFEQSQLEVLAEEIASYAAQADLAQCELMTRLRTFDERDGWAPLGFRSCAHWLSWRTGMSLITARERVRVAHALKDLPKIEHAMRDARLSYSKVRALTRAATPQTQETYLELAMHSTAAELDRICRAHANVDATEDDEVRRARFVRRREREGGMVRIEIQLPQEEAEVVWEAIAQATEAPPAPRDASAEPPSVPASAEPPSVPASAEAPEPPANEGPDADARRADAVVALAEGTLQSRGGAARGSSFELLLMSSTRGLEEPSDAPGGFLLDGTPLRTAAARLIACDCATVQAELGPEGLPLSIGRRTRVIPVHLHRALRIRDGGCAFPGCTAHRHVDGHHIQHWVDGGETSLDNLVYLCRRHHHAVHDGLVDVAMEQGVPVFRDAEGRLIERVPEAGCPRPLHEPARFPCPEPLWEGDPLDLDAALLGLCSARKR